MSFFDQVYQSIFPKKEEKTKVLSHEVIKRNDKYLTDYKRWQLSPDRKDLLKLIASSYQLKQNDISESPEVHLLKSSVSNGFAISYDNQINPTEFQFLFDMLAEIVASLGYKYALSDVTITAKEGIVETCERHYLKPKNDNKVPINQRYGNVLIEYILIDDSPGYIKLVANTYNDRNYSSAEDFESLAKYLFELT